MACGGSAGEMCNSNMYPSIGYLGMYVVHTKGTMSRRVREIDCKIELVILCLLLNRYQGRVMKLNEALLLFYNNWIRDMANFLRKLAT